MFISKSMRARAYVTININKIFPSRKNITKTSLLIRIWFVNFMTPSRDDNVAQVSTGHDFRRIRPPLPPQGWWGPDDGRHDEKEERKRNVRALEIKMIRFRERAGEGRKRRGEGKGSVEGPRALPGAHVIALWLPNSVWSGSRALLAQRGLSSPPPPSF